MKSFINKMSEFERNIVKMNTKQLMMYVEKQTAFIKLDKSGIILESMVRSYEDIPDAKEKFSFIVNRYKELHPIGTEKIIEYACFHLQEEIVEILLQLGFDASHRDAAGLLTCPIRILNHHPDLIYTKSLIEKKQKTIFRLLLQYDLDLNILDKGKYNMSLFQMLRTADKQYQIDWIDSFYDEFNPKQRKEWGKVRLQSIF